MLAVFALAFLIKAGSVQLVNGKDWRARGDRQQTSEREVPAPRGEIFDATRRVLAESREMVRLEIAPREVREPLKLRRALANFRFEITENGDFYFGGSQALVGGSVVHTLNGADRRVDQVEHQRAIVAAEVGHPTPAARSHQGPQERHRSGHRVAHTTGGRSTGRPLDGEAPQQDVQRHPLVGG